jgi:hypothetical protein
MSPGPATRSSSPGGTFLPGAERVFQDLTEGDGGAERVFQDLTEGEGGAERVFQDITEGEGGGGGPQA